MWHVLQGAQHRTKQCAGALFELAVVLITPYQAAMFCSLHLLTATLNIISRQRCCTGPTYTADFLLQALCGGCCRILPITPLPKPMGVDVRLHPSYRVAVQSQLCNSAHLLSRFSSSAVGRPPTNTAAAG
jgi:hypothetical protein